MKMSRHTTTATMMILVLRELLRQRWGRLGSLTVSDVTGIAPEAFSGCAALSSEAGMALTLAEGTGLRRGTALVSPPGNLGNQRSRKTESEKAFGGGILGCEPLCLTAKRIPDLRVESLGGIHGIFRSNLGKIFSLDNRGGKL